MAATGAFFFLDIDTQRDLILRTGALAVPGAERMISKLRRLFEFARKNAVTVISTAMARDPDDPEFDGLPAHCVRATEGQRKIDDTTLYHPLLLENRLVDRNLIDMVRRHQQIVIEKPSFDPFLNPMAERLLRVLPKRAILFGLPLEHGVRLAALGLRSRGVKAAVVGDAVLPLDGGEGKKATEEMRRAGVDFITVEILLGAIGD